MSSPPSRPRWPLNWLWAGAVAIASVAVIGPALLARRTPLLSQIVALVLAIVCLASISAVLEVRRIFNDWDRLAQKASDAEAALKLATATAAEDDASTNNGERLPDGSTAISARRAVLRALLAAPWTAALREDVVGMVAHGLPCEQVLAAAVLARRKHELTADRQSDSSEALSEAVRTMREVGRSESEVNALVIREGKNRIAARAELVPLFMRARSDPDSTSGVLSSQAFYDPPWPEVILHSISRLGAEVNATGAQAEYLAGEEWRTYYAEDEAAGWDPECTIFPDELTSLHDCLLFLANQTIDIPVSEWASRTLHSFRGDGQP